jgi:hypothetical protein
VLGNKIISGLVLVGSKNKLVTTPSIVILAYLLWNVSGEVSNTKYLYTLLYLANLAVPSNTT